MYKYMVRSNLY